MSDRQDTEPRRRRLLLAATGVASGVAAGAAGVPFVASMMPSERAKAAGAPVEVDISALQAGQKVIVEWRGKPVWIVYRTKQMLDAVHADEARVADPQSERSEQPAYAQNEYRSLKPEYLVLVGICTHLGCSPVDRFERKAEPFEAHWNGGFYCPCHGSLFDLAGRVYKNKPAPTNLPVPPHKFVSEQKLIIGEDAGGA
jgi:ubiquinol-cytochrome c reductase iron-sulfur subunit